MRRALQRTALLAFFLWLLACGVLFTAQEHLLFHPQTISTARAKMLSQRANLERSLIAAQTGTLELYLQTPDAHSSHCLLYFGGNGQEASRLLDDYPRLGQRNLLTVNYPGYGASTGRPSEATLKQAALNAYDALAKRRLCASIDVMGRSLGTGIATYTAAQRRIRRVVLVSPYDSITSVAQELHWWAPVRALLRHKLESIALARRIRSPVLMIVAPQDRTIPRSHSDSLFRAWQGPKSLYLVPNAGHNELLDGAEPWLRIRAFLDAP